MKSRVAVRAAIVLLGAMIVAACTHHGPPRPSSTSRGPGTTRPTSGLLLEYTASGGLCPWGLCGAKVTIQRNGAYHLTNGQTESDGQLDGATLRQLTQRIESQIGTLANLPPSGEICPSAYDGSDITITFHAGGAPTTVSNCAQPNPDEDSVAIPGNNPLLRYTVDLVGRLLNQQPPVSRALVTYHESGGHCREICPEENVTVNEDGSWTATLGATSTSGTLDANARAQLARQIEAAVSASSSLPPSTGCPSAYDGRDIEITLRSGRQTVSLSNCRVDLGADPALQSVIETVSSLL